MYRTYPIGMIAEAAELCKLLIRKQCKKKSNIYSLLLFENLNWFKAILQVWEYLAVCLMKWSHWKLTEHEPLLESIISSFSRFGQGHSQPSPYLTPKLGMDASKLIFRRSHQLWTWNCLPGLCCDAITSLANICKGQFNGEMACNFCQ